MDSHTVEFDRVHELFMATDASRRAFRFMIDTFGKTITYEIMINISQNITLFRLFQNADCEKFINIDSALQALNRDNASRTKTLIHFTELNLYGMFSPEQYAIFAGDLLEKVYDGANISFRPKQIVLTGLPQKLIFICLGDERVVEKIRGYVSKKYKCGITHTKTDDRIEITVQGMGGNTYEEAQSTYHDLIDFIGTKNADHSTAGKMLPIPVVNSRERYIVADISHDINRPHDLKNVIESLKTIHGESIVVNFVIINGNNNGQIIVGGMNKDKVRPQKSVKWVRENPPGDKEITTEYYARYTANCDEHISSSQLGKIVRDFGYKPMRGTHHRYWVKK